MIKMNTGSILINSDELMWDKSTNSFLGEISSFARAGEGNPFIKPIWQNGKFIAQGFQIASHVTGRVLVMDCFNIDEHDGDIHSWTFKPLEREFDFMVRIFND